MKTARPACFAAIALAAALIAAADPAAPAPDPRPVEAFSISGAELRRPELTPQTLARLEADLSEARAALDKDPSGESAAIWLGRRLAYLGRFNEAIDAFNAGLGKHPDSYRLLRHRGHRYLTTRQFTLAIEDLTRAQDIFLDSANDEIEPDGAPNPAGKPRSTDWSNICYHLGLAYYCTNQHTLTMEAMNMALDTPLLNDDITVSTRYWIANTFAHHPDAPARITRLLAQITPDMDIVENHAYHDILLLHKGLKTLEDVMAPAEKDPFELATRGYGVAMWHRASGRTKEADALIDRVLATGLWHTFGYLAAEADRANAKP